MNLRIDRHRLLSRLAALAAIGDTRDGGCRRLALTEEDRQGRDLVVSWMRELGLDVRVDAIGNILGLMPGAEATAPVMTGSHIDTVATGGKYDGAYGVLAGLEVVATLKDAGIEPPRPLAVAAFTNEEGSRFQPDMLGSLVYAGGLSVEAARAAPAVDGPTLGECLDAIGYRGEMAPGAIEPHAYVELHIEQGPILDVEGVTIGAVENLQGISWTELTLTGQSNHAGTTPMHMRRDAGRVAAEIAVFVHRLALEIGHGQVATVGRMVIEPNYINVIPRLVTMTVDLRNPDPALFAAAQARFGAFLDTIAAESGVAVARRSLAQFDPVLFAPEIVATVERTAGTLGHSVRRITSGAGHDAQMMARLAPTAMIFVPSVGGVSHNPAEHTAPDHLEAGANVLLHTMLALAGRTPAET